jgi:hypothetical protein
MLNKQPTWNNGSVMGLVVAVGAFLVGITGYVSLQLSPITARLEADVGWQNSMNQFQLATHYHQGQSNIWMEEHSEAEDHHDELYHLLVDRVTREEQKSAEAEVSRKAIGDYSKENRGLLERRE